MEDIENFDNGKGISEEAQEPLMTKMGFGHGRDGKLWSKDISLGGDKVTIWVDFRKSNKPGIWTQPKIGEEQFNALGERRAIEAVISGILDPKWDARQSIIVKNEEGGNDIIEMSEPYSGERKMERREAKKEAETRERSKVKEPELVSITPVTKMEISVSEAKHQMEQLQRFVDTVMMENVDYGIIEGMHKSSLWKSGAEKLLNVHGMAAEFELVDKVEDWDNGFFYYRYKCIIKSRKYNEVIAECEGSCNSREKKYVNSDPYSIVNTLQKMAQKRALVGATLIATRTSMKFVDSD